MYPRVECPYGVASAESASLLLSSLEECAFLSALPSPVYPPPYHLEPSLFGLPVERRRLCGPVLRSVSGLTLLFFATRTLLSSNCVLTRIWNVNSTVCLIEIEEFVSTFGLDYMPSS